MSKDLKQNNYRKFIKILAYLSPETLWDMQDLDSLEIFRVPNFMETVETFLETSKLDARILFILKAVERITKKSVSIVHVIL